MSRLWPQSCIDTAVKSCVAALLFPVLIQAQSVTNPRAIPHTGNPPVIFLNGFETDCSTASFQKAFGIADQILAANNRASLFFNNCNFPNSPSIEKLGAAFGAFLQGLTYDDGQPVTSVDVVGYSMGGLIVRSYISGKQEAQGVFNPPATVPIGKVVFIATPNFGSPVGALALGTSVQADELSSGSHFLIDLNTWNQNRDDLRGLESIALAGTGGTGIATTPGFDDGLVPLSSASLRFYAPGRTRVLPLCHVNTPGLITQVGLCPSNSKGIARVNAATDDNIRIVVSFLTGTPEWQTIGQAAEENSFLKNGGGIMVRARTASNGTILPSSVNAGKTLNMSNSEIAYTDLLAAGPVNITVNAGSQSFNQTVNVTPGGAQALIVKPGPVVNAVIPAASQISPLVVAPRMLVAIYGSGLDQSAVTFNGSPLTVLYSSSGQINAVMPADAATGLGKLTVQNVGGSQTLNVLIEPAFPAVFTLDQTGTGAAAAVNATNGRVVSASNPVHAGEFLELYLTGLGMTQPSARLDYAALQPTVSVGGMSCPVTFAGAAPTFVGLDQINCRVPDGLGAQSTATVTVRTGNRVSPPVTIAVQ